MTSKFRYRPGTPITLETIDWAVDRMAVIMTEAPDGGRRYLPIWRRLQRERELILEEGSPPKLASALDKSFPSRAIVKLIQ